MSETPHDHTPLPTLDMSAVPMPTGRTVRRRTSLPRQLMRFAALNLRLMRMVRKAHDKR